MVGGDWMNLIDIFQIDGVGSVNTRHEFLAKAFGLDLTDDREPFLGGESLFTLNVPNYY